MHAKYNTQKCSYDDHEKDAASYATARVAAVEKHAGLQAMLEQGGGLHLSAVGTDLRPDVVRPVQRASRLQSNRPAHQCETVGPLATPPLQIFVRRDERKSSKKTRHGGRSVWRYRQHQRPFGRSSAMETLPYRGARNDAPSSLLQHEKRFKHTKNFSRTSKQERLQQ